jgi:hypothetical protein
MCKQKCKQIFIVIKHKNITQNEQNKASGTRSYLKLILNKLKIMGALFLFIPF